MDIKVKKLTDLVGRGGQKWPEKNGTSFRSILHDQKVQLSDVFFFRMLAEAERIEKSEYGRREKEARQQHAEAKRRRAEELQRQKQEEALRKIQEREQKRQQTALIKEQVRIPLY